MDDDDWPVPVDDDDDWPVPVDDDDDWPSPVDDDSTEILDQPAGTPGELDCGCDAAALIVTGQHTLGCSP